MQLLSFSEGQLCKMNKKQPNSVGKKIEKSPSEGELNPVVIC